jgi:hypothetical protein
VEAPELGKKSSGERSGWGKTTPRRLKIDSFRFGKWFSDVGRLIMVDLLS